MDPTTRQLFQEMLLLLDGCVDTLTNAAEREKHLSKGPLRKITEQHRLAAVEKLIARATQHLERHP